MDNENGTKRLSARGTFLLHLAVGVVIGIGGVLPGVSGGVMAVSLGLYKPMIDALAGFFKAPKKNFLFLLPVGLGAGLGFLLGAVVLSKLMRRWYVEVMWLFLGLVAGGIPSFLHEANERGFKKRYLIATVLAVGMGARVTVLDINHQRLAYLDEVFGSQITTLYSSRANLLTALKKADLVIGCVMLAPGRECQKLVMREDLKIMKKGAVMVDIVIDQGGCFETSHPTTHADPVYEVDGILHYCVANIPGSVPRTSTEALVNSTLAHGIRITQLGLEGACKADPCLMSGLNTYKGKLTFEAVAEALDIPYVDPNTLM